MDRIRGRVDLCCHVISVTYFHSLEYVEVYSVVVGLCGNDPKCKVTVKDNLFAGKLSYSQEQLHLCLNFNEDTDKNLNVTKAFELLKFLKVM